MQRLVSDEVTASTSVENIIPAFKENQSGTGLVAMVKVFNNIIKSENPTTAQPSSGFIFSYDPSGIFIMLIIAISVWLMWKNRCRGTNTTNNSNNNLFSTENNGRSRSNGGGSSTSF